MSSKPKKRAYLKKFGGKMLDVVRIMAMALLPLLVLYLTIHNLDRIKASDHMMVIILVIILLCGLGEVVLHKLSEKTWDIVAEARNDIEFDENGLYREKNNIQKLTKAEREELGKQRLAEVERLLGTGTLRKITKDGSDHPMQDLKKLQGLAPVKQKVREIKARTEFDRTSHTGMDNGYHMCLMGNPGTGKTTVVSILTGILYRNHVIKQNKYIETDGNSLRGDTAKETSEKINLLIRFAKGKVLFIDEAYAMLDGGNSQDVIATLIKQMEDHRKDFVLIIAGYEDEMKELIEANPGFKSRISTYLHFPDYGNEELCDIFSAMANEHDFYVPAETRDKLAVRFENERKQKYFGNARTARTVLDESISRHALRIKEGKIKKEDRFKILPGDVSVTVQTI